MVDIEPTWQIERSKMKKVLIVGKDSYIGEAFYKWLKKYPEQYAVDIVSSKNYEWKKVDFYQYDTVVNFAGIAHINNITEEMKPLFYSVNRDLSIEIATWAKDHGVKHFIVFSSMNVYGDYCENITDRNAEHPTSFYGDSKLQGDIGIRKLEDENFTVAYIRPPFVYGKGCPGNYNIISKIAKKTPIFPTYKNKKSMIYIDNLCEFLRLVIDARLGGILTPQNKELKSTADLVRAIAKVNGKRILFTGIFNWLVTLTCRRVKLVRKAFVNDCYEPELSNYWDYVYCVVSFEDSINSTES